MAGTGALLVKAKCILLLGTGASLIQLACQQVCKPFGNLLSDQGSVLSW